MLSRSHSSFQEAHRRGTNSSHGHTALWVELEGDSLQVSKCLRSCRCVELQSQSSDHSLRNAIVGEDENVTATLSQGLNRVSQCIPELDGTRVSCGAPRSE